MSGKFARDNCRELRTVRRRPSVYSP